ncbi:Tn3 family transposase [Klebsiella pneumoniae]|uniref:Tn3 family transposase n=1 Tax=Klebsiella pneumoniae TaxID=573 RepID=UPI0028BE3C20|nr:Tn3 family transposase [Klebsiella pneumoniae]
MVAAQVKLPNVTRLGDGHVSIGRWSVFPTARHGEAMDMVNAKYGSVPGLKAYTHVSDQFAPFTALRQSIPATVSEAPYILDGLLMNEVGRHVREQYADTAGFTDHLFGASSLLGYNLVLRIEDLPSSGCTYLIPSDPRSYAELVGGKAREILSLRTGLIFSRTLCRDVRWQNPGSQLLRKLASYPRQNNLAVALREVGRIERTLFFIIERILIRTCSGVLRSVLTRRAPPCAQKCAPYREAGGKFAIARQRGSTTESLGSIY